MTVKQIIGIVSLVFALGLLFNGISVISSGEGPSISDPSGLGVSRAVGAFLPFVIFFILGVWLIQKPKS